jgi:hypothetical protein
VNDSYELTKNDLIPFLPHLGDQYLARINNTGKSVAWYISEPSILRSKSRNVPDFNVLKWAERLHDVLSGDAHRAEAYASYGQHTVFYP